MAQITLLDGGMGQELVARSGGITPPLWATQVMMEHPGLVAQIHTDYFAAGASIATTNTYNILHDRLLREGQDHLFHALHLRALAEALEARALAGRGRIAGSMGPLGESYRPDLAPPVAEAAATYAEKARIMAPHVDLILIETISSLGLAEGALMGAQAAGLPVWLSLSVDDGDGSRLRSGEPMAGVKDLIARFPVAAVLANCSMPEAMGAAMSVLQGFGLPFGAYANGFTAISPLPLPEGQRPPAYCGRHDLTPQKYADFAMGWLDQGATILGGCCDVGPAHIRHLAERLRAAGHEIQ